MIISGRSSQLWIFVLALGLGVAIGVIISTGLGFEKSDSARFIGSLLGSLIAVSGAVALYYLKESEEKSNKRRHLAALLKVARDFVPLAIKDIKERNHPQDAAETYKAQFDRCVAYAEKYQFDDYAISEAYSSIMTNNVAHLIFSDEKSRDEKFLDAVCFIIENSQNDIQRSLESLNQADEKLKVLS